MLWHLFLSTMSWHSTPNELIEIAKENRDEFIGELTKLVKYLESTPENKTAWFELIEQVKWYLNRLNKNQ